jgi:PncC family amidohydrolase
MKFHANHAAPSIALLVKRLGILLTDKKSTLSVAESCTGGLIGASITAMPGSSGFFSGGVIAYANEIKQRTLGVPAHILEKKGAVSADTAQAMAQGALRLFKTDYAISVTGIAGPAGGSKKKPVGLVFVGIGTRNQVRSYRYLFKGGRTQVRKLAMRAALERIIEELLR